MSIPYEATGRTNQKARTRAALVQAARALLADGITATVEQAADRAAISRTTAYRYFQNQRALLIAVFPEIDVPSLLDPDPPADPAARLDQAITRLTRQVIDHEPELRAQLRLSLESQPAEPDRLPFRTGRAIGWIKDALAPLGEQMSAREIHRLALAIRATTGIEAFVWLTDVAGLSPEDAAQLMRASAQALLRDTCRVKQDQTARSERHDGRASRASNRRGPRTS